MAKVDNFIFVDEAGDPGEPFKINPETGKKIATGASPFYIISALCVTEKQLNQISHRFSEIKASFGYTREVKSSDIGIPLYTALLELVNELEVAVYYCLIDKNNYKGRFRIDGIRKLHNVFDEYNLVKTVAFAITECAIENIEVVIDRTDRRLLDGKFDSFDNYMRKKVKKYLGIKEGDPINHITHINSVYVNIMQLSDIVCGAIRDNFTGKNTDLIRVIKEKNLVKVTAKYERS